jgi:hypothetical protein
MKYNEEFKYLVKGREVNIGIIDGNNTIVLIVPGQNTGIFGYEDRYLKLSKRINKKYGSTVVITSNPFQNENPIDELMYVINRYAERFSDYKVYFFGFSKGANIGSHYATLESKITRMVLVNGPLMINPHKTREGILRFQGERMTFIYGSLDPSYDYSGLVNLETKDNIKLVILDNINHNVENEEVFLNLTDEALFFVI